MTRFHSITCRTPCPGWGCQCTPGCHDCPDRPSHGGESQGVGVDENGCCATEDEPGSTGDGGMIGNKSGPGGTGIPHRTWPQHREIGIGVLAYDKDSPQATPHVQHIATLGGA